MKIINFDETDIVLRKIHFEVQYYLFCYIDY